MAAVWTAVVCWVYIVDHREFFQSRDPWVLALGYVWSVFHWHYDHSKGFVAFDKFKTLLQDENGKISGPRTVIAGFGAGTTESLLAVTPFESIKTQMSVTSPCNCLEPGFRNLLWPFYWQLGHFLVSMTGNLKTLACVAFCTVVKLFSRKEVFEVSSRVLYPRQQDRPQIPLPDSRATPRWSNWLKATLRLGRNWELEALLPLEAWQAS